MEEKKIRIRELRMTGGQGRLLRGGDFGAEGKEMSHIKMLKSRVWKDLRRWSGPGYLRVVRVP